MVICILSTGTVLASSGRSRIDLCRNGMWITDDLPGLKPSKFTDRRPFHAVIKVTAQDGQIHQLIRKSEGPLHNHIEARKWLRPEEAKKLKEAFDKIADFLLEKLERLAEESFEVDDFLNIQIEDSGAAGGRRTGNIGQFEEEPEPRPRVSRGNRNPPNPGPTPPNLDPNPVPTPNVFKRSGNAVPFGATPVPTGRRSWEVELHPRQNLNADTEAEIRFILDENIDSSCDPGSEEQFVILTAVELNGQAVAADELIRGADGVLGVRLGQFNPGENYRLKFDYELPAGLDVPSGERVLLRAEIVRRRQPMREQ